MSVRSRAVPLPRIDDLVAMAQPDEPLLCSRPDTLRETAAAFVGAFPGDVLYAVKCNPEPSVLRALWAGGVRHFDCASIGEIRLLRGLFPDAEIHFMHPVKSRVAIAEAWERHGVRSFVLDHPAELTKIRDIVGAVSDLTLIVRLALPRGSALCDLSGKFGAAPEDAAMLLRSVRRVAGRVGLSFHVGSQCLDPLAWRRAIARAGEVSRQAGIVLDILDVGGGFPVAYTDCEPPPLGAFLAEIEAGAEDFAAPGLRLWAEPGRALVAGGVSTVARVELRRGDALHLNDGVFGNLSDAGPLAGLRFPVRLLRESAAETADFRFFGPTCDSIDTMQGPFRLPADVCEGDWIEIGQTGAYGSALRTGFNGFGGGTAVEVRDPPLLGPR